MDNLVLSDGGLFPAFGLGTWQMGGGYSADYSRDGEIVSLLRDSLDMGYVHIDTAEMYGAGHVEELVGQALSNRSRNQVFLTTKVWKTNLRYDCLLKSLEGSLHRLQTDYADLYLVHWPNEDIPLEETFEALNVAVAEDKVKRVGVSNFGISLLERARGLCATPIVTNQVRFNLHERDPELSGLLRFCQENHIVVTAYSPLKDGVLNNPAVQSVARKHGATAAQVALRWLTRQSLVATISMSSNREHLRQNLEANSLELDAHDVRRLDTISSELI